MKRLKIPRLQQRFTGCSGYLLGTLASSSGLPYRDADKPREDERMEDGYTVKYLPAELLRELNIVDTPGTNVILERQQRLTEEYVPRADMVLFTMSAGARLTRDVVTCKAVSTCLGIVPSMPFIDKYLLYMHSDGHCRCS